jgi:cytochrome c556
VLKRSVVLCGAWIGFAAVALPQQGSGVPGPAVIAARQASLDMSSITLRAMGDAMKAGREAKSQAYAAVVLSKWAKALPQMFPAGTGKGDTSAETQALDAIWKDRAGFDQAAANYAAVTTRLAALAAANDTGGFTKQLEEVDQACRSCHAIYKAGPQGAPKK